LGPVSQTNPLTNVQVLWFCDLILVTMMCFAGTSAAIGITTVEVRVCIRRKKFALPFDLPRPPALQTPSASEGGGDTSARDLAPPTSHEKNAKNESSKEHALQMLRTALETLEAADWDHEPVNHASKLSRARGPAPSKSAKDNAAGTSTGVKPTLTTAKSRSHMPSIRGRPAAAGARSTRVVPESAQSVPVAKPEAPAAGPVRSGAPEAPAAGPVPSGAPASGQDALAAATGLQVEGQDAPHQAVPVAPPAAEHEEDLAMARPWDDASDHESDAPTGPKP
jgi:hypothetical protein